MGLDEKTTISQISKRIRCSCRITPQMGMASLPITKTINSSIFRLISVTHEQGSMPVKNNAFLKYKLHPSGNHGTNFDMIKTPETHNDTERSLCLVYSPQTYLIQVPRRTSDCQLEDEFLLDDLFLRFRFSHRGKKHMN